MRELRRYLLLLMIGLALGGYAWSQDDQSPPEAEEATATIAEEDGASDEDAPEIDDESYIDIDEEDFRPTEEIDADQSIPFPTDI